MKNILKYSLVTLLAVTTVMLSCTREEEDVRLDPSLSTMRVMDIGSDSAVIEGFVVAEGDGFTERGVVYDVTENPTIESNKVAYADTLDDAAYSVVLRELDYATHYYARAYAMNGTTPLYGDTVSFTTLPILATVTTTEATGVDGTSATTGGEVTDNGGAAVTLRGVCYGEWENPTVDSMTTEDGDGLGAFTSDLTGLDGLTTYYVRAYAVNAAGVAYGEQISFTTDVAELTWYIPGDYVEASYPGTDLLNWAPDASPYIKSGIADPNNLEGYVYMDNTTNQWKVATTMSWDDTNYGGTTDAGTGTLSTDGDNITLPQGYYKLNVNAQDLTFEYVDTDWGVIGDATPGAWSTDTNLEYIPDVQTWRGGVTLAETGAFKFRANDDWVISYGSVPADGTLDTEDDNNIPSPGVAADYAFELDLSTPLNYTYSANRWGVIGSATPDAWDSDQDMTWDDVSGLFTLTVDLVVGEIKFRANDDWVINWGGDIGAMTQDGANIAISEAGNYTLTLDPWEGVATITLN